MSSLAVSGTDSRQRSEQPAEIANRTARDGRTGHPDWTANPYTRLSTTDTYPVNHIASLLVTLNMVIDAVKLHSVGE